MNDPITSYVYGLFAGSVEPDRLTVENRFVTDVNNIISKTALRFKIHPLPNGSFEYRNETDITVDMNNIYFIRGMIESNVLNDPRLFDSSCLGLRYVLADKNETHVLGVPCNFIKNRLVFEKWNGHDLLEKVYRSRSSDHIGIDDIYKRVFHVLDTRTLRVLKSLPDAILPYKERYSDAGLDLNIIKKVKEDGNLLYYDTGIIVVPPIGYYTEVVARSSMAKSGFILANSVGIIDGSYRGSVIIALLRVRVDAEEPVLPARVAQLILRKHYHVSIDTDTTDDLIKSTRGASGGLGSAQFDNEGIR